MLVIGLLCTTAFADSPVAVTRGDNNTTVTVTASTLDPDEETTILVVDKGATIAAAFADTTMIKHIDQTAASDEGVATFKFMYAENAPLDVYVGYATMAADAEPFEAVVDEVKTEDPVDPPVNPDPEEPTFTYGDVNDDKAIDVLDASTIVSYLVSNIPFANDNCRAAADVNGDTAIDVLDASTIVSYLVSQIEFPVNEAE